MPGTQKADVSITKEARPRTIKTQYSTAEAIQKSISYPKVSIRLLQSSWFFILKMMLSPYVGPNFCSTLPFAFSSTAKSILVRTFPLKSYPGSARKSHWHELNLVSHIKQKAGQETRFLFQIATCPAKTER